jgi:hypothetical protein
VHDARDPMGLGPDWSETTPAPPDPTPVVTGSSPRDDARHPDDVRVDDSFIDGSNHDGYIDDQYLDVLFDDEPPFDDGPLHEAPPGPSQRRAPRKPDSVVGSEAPIADRVLATLRQVLASQHGRESSEVAATVRRLSASSKVLELLSEETLSVFEGVFEVLLFEAASVDGVGVVNFDDMPNARNYRKSVRLELERLAEMGRLDVLTNPFGEWDAMCEAVQAEESLRGALRLIEAIETKANAEVKMRLHRNLPAPTARRAAQNNNWAKSAADWVDEADAYAASRSSIALSSGYPSLDSAVTVTGDPVGFIKPGEFWVIGAGTGHGKSAFIRRVVVSMLQDLVAGWGFPDARGILAFTEEEAEDVARAAMVGRGQPFHHLAPNLILAKVGQSRERLIKALFDVVIDAYHKAKATGRPITEFLTYYYVLDYIQGIHEEGENPDGEAIAKTADLLMRGIAAWDVEMMSTISGVDFREYAGMDWPAGMENHRVAVIAMSQLRKESTDVYFRTGKSSPSDFSVVDANGQVCWQPRENDYAIPDRSDLRGSGVLLNHATGLIFLHRSQPTASQVKDPVTGKTVRLSDTRARFIVPKARKSVSMPYIPMRFDTNPEGFRGQFYDDLAHTHGVQEGRLKVTDAYQQPGDPMLPQRPKRGAFTGKRY